ncbi:MAG: carboxymuconolactone decarboxylase family protein [Anaerolineaceae bacterium]|nr:carboxymuconolactone decarboxylase family protein [Anaerolineaceae bacterium]
MSRIRLLETSEMTPEMAQIVADVGRMTGDFNGMRAVAHRPDIVQSFGPFYWKLQMEGLLDRKLIELVRLGIAQVNQCKNCLGARYQDSIEQGLTEEMVEALPGVEASPLFTDREKAAIVFGQKMAMDHYSVGDEDFVRLHKYFTEEEIVELGFDVAMFIGIGRFFAVLDATNTVCSIP